MKTPLHILHLENDPEDAALVQFMLAGITCTTTCVQSCDAFVATPKDDDMTHIGTVVKTPPIFGHEGRSAKYREGSNI